jgi:hypothetical protein
VSLHGEYRRKGLFDRLVTDEEYLWRSFSKRELEAYSSVRNRRSRVVYFFDVSPKNDSSIQELRESVAEQCRAWFCLDRRLRHGWKEYFRRHAQKIKTLGRAIHRNRELLAAKFMEIYDLVIEMKLLERRLTLYVADGAVREYSMPVEYLSSSQTEK